MQTAPEEKLEKHSAQADEDKYNTKDKDEETSEQSIHVLCRVLLETYSVSTIFVPMMLFMMDVKTYRTIMAENPTHPRPQRRMRLQRMKL